MSFFKNRGFVLILLGIILIILALVYGFETGEKTLIAEGDVFEYLVTYVEDDSVADTSTYTMTVGAVVEIYGSECHYIAIDIVNEDAARTGAARTAMAAYGPVNTSVLSGEMLILKDTLDLIQKMPLSIVADHEISTILAYSYEGDHGYPFNIGKSWTYVIDGSSTTGHSWQTAMSAEVVGMENVTVPAGEFICYRIEHKASGEDEPGLVEWYSRDIGQPVKVIDYGNYVGTEIRELQSIN